MIRAEAAPGVWALSLLVTLALAACAGPDTPSRRPSAGVAVSEAAAAAVASHPPHDHAAAPAVDDPADFSIYHAESVWTDQHGEDVALGSLAGKARVVAMVYTSCAYACPRLMLDMKRIEGELPPERSEDVGFVLVTIDPERDTPQRLAEFARGSRLDPDRWTLLTGDEGDVLELAALLGVQYRHTAPGEFVHSNLLTVLDAEGRVVHRQLGLGADPAATLAVLSRLAG